MPSMQAAVRSGAGFLYWSHVYQLRLRSGADGSRLGGSVRAGQRPSPVGVPSCSDYRQHPVGAVHVPVLQGANAVLVFRHQIQP